MPSSTKKIVYEHVARMTKAFSSAGRLELLDLIAQGEKTVETLSQATGLGIKNTSAQLKELRAAHLVTSRKVGRHVFYSLKDHHVATLWVALRKLAEGHFSEVQDLLASAKNTYSYRFTGKELMMKIKKGQAVLLDVRPKDEFEAGHLPQAISIPLEELKKKVNSLPRNQEIIVYCRGPLCIWADTAVKTLTKKGLKAYKLSDGTSEWRAAGGEIEISKS